MNFSHIIHGHWRLSDWKMSNQALLKLTQQSMDLGVTTFDHADIYGDYSCEKIFGKTLALQKGLRKDIQIITKCGIKLLSDKFPTRKIKSYDYSFDHIVSSVEHSLENFRTDYMDLLLLHRPAPFFDPAEVAKAFTYLKKSGKVLHFGVSNFTPAQYEMLAAFVEDSLATNQVEISPFCLEHFKNGNIDFFLKNKIKPMAWSPLAGGGIMNPKDEKAQRIFDSLTEVANELNVEEIDKVIYSWLLKHPVGMNLVVGTQKIERIKHAVDALQLNMSMAQWYKIYLAALGEELP